MKILKSVPFFISVAVFYALLHLLVQFESQSPDSGIKTINDGLWYFIVTITTVGYGDLSPVTTGGKFVGGVFVILSVGLLGALIGKASNYFIDIREKRKMGHFGTKFSNHVVIVGWDGFAQSIASILVEAGRKVAVVTEDKDAIELMYEDYPRTNFFALHTSFNSIANYAKVNIEKSIIVFVNLERDTDKLVAILNLKKSYPNIEFMVSLDETKLKDTFKSAGAKHIISKNEIASKLVASHIFEPAVADFSSDLMVGAEHEDDYDIQQYYITEKNPFAGQKYGDLFSAIKEKYDALVIGLAKKTTSGYKLYKLPKDDLPVESGDYAIFINNSDSAKKIKKLFKVAEGFIIEEDDEEHSR